MTTVTVHTDPEGAISNLGALKDPLWNRIAETLEEIGDNFLRTGGAKSAATVSFAFKATKDGLVLTYGITKSLGKGDRAIGAQIVGTEAGGQQIDLDL